MNLERFEELLALELDGVLSSAERTELDSACSAHGGFKRLREENRKLIRMMSTVAPRQIPATLADDIMSRLEEEWSEEDASAEAEEASFAGERAVRAPWWSAFLGSPFLRWGFGMAVVAIFAYMGLTVTRPSGPRVGESPSPSPSIPTPLLVASAPTPQEIEIAKAQIPISPPKMTEPTTRSSEAQKEIYLLPPTDTDKTPSPPAGAENAGVDAKPAVEAAQVASAESSAIGKPVSPTETIESPTAPTNIEPPKLEGRMTASAALENELNKQSAIETGAPPAVQASVALPSEASPATFQPEANQPRMAQVLESARDDLKRNPSVPSGTATENGKAKQGLAGNVALVENAQAPQAAAQKREEKKTPLPDVTQWQRAMRGDPAPSIDLAVVANPTSSTESSMREEILSPGSPIQIGIQLPSTPSVSNFRKVQPSQGNKRDTAGAVRPPGAVNLRNVELAVVRNGGTIIRKSPDPSDASLTRIHYRMTPSHLTAFLRELESLGMMHRSESGAGWRTQSASQMKDAQTSFYVVEQGHIPVSPQTASSTAQGAEKEVDIDLIARVGSTTEPSTH